MRPIPEVTLRPTTEGDLDFVVSAERAAENAPYIRHWPLEQHRAALRDPDIAHRIVEVSGPWPEDGGYLILLGLTNPHLGIEFKRLVITCKGAGLGRAAVRAVKRWAFLTHGAHRLWLEVKTLNARAHRLYASEGFREEGTLRDVIRAADGWESLIVMSMLAPEYHATRGIRAAGTAGAA
jgi:RimJ/RimL family protein N-acetyltransferase